VEVVSDAGGQTSSVCHLFMVDGNPAVAFARQGSVPSYTRADSSTGDSWPANQPGLDSGFVNSGVYGAGLYAGLPCIAYQDFTTKQIRFLLAQDGEGNAWNAPEFVASYAPAPNCEASFIVVNGKPAIAWAGNGENVISYAVYK
jgi:hypothetical protein